jgi:hypothetical protein
MRSFVAVLVLLGGLGLTGCGGSDAAGSDDVTSDPTSSPSSPAPSTPSRADTGETCEALYQPPDQLVPHAIEFVHGRTVRDPASEARQITAGLSAVAATTVPSLAADIAVVRISVDTQRALAESGSDADQDLASFDAATDRLAQACATYGK